MTFTGDVLKPFSNSIWLGTIFFGVALPVVVVVLLYRRSKHQPLTEIFGNPKKRQVRVRKKLPADLPILRDVSIFCVLALVFLVPTAICQSLLAPTGQSADSVSAIARFVPALDRLTDEVQRTNEVLAQTHDVLVKAQVAIEKVSSGTSDDPRKELGNLSIDWTADAFLNAVSRGDERAVRLFLEGGMNPMTSGESGAQLPGSLAKIAQNPAPILELLIGAGIDLDASYRSSGFASTDHHYTLLGRAIDADNRRLVEALVKAGASPNTTYDTFGSMGVSVRVTPLLGALRHDRHALLAPLLAAGADPSAEDYGAYRVARAKLVAATDRPFEGRADLEGAFELLVPAGTERERIDDMFDFDAVNAALIDVGRQSLQSFGDPVRKRALDEQYERLQVERQRLRSKLGIFE